MTDSNRRSLPLRDVCAARLDVDGVEARARRHEEPVALRAAEADVGADLRQQNLADALAALMDAQGVPQAILVGHSLGGMVALQMWARHPKRVAGLVLAASSPGFGHGSGDFQQAFIAQRLAPLEAGKSMADVADALVPTMVAPMAQPPCTRPISASLNPCSLRKGMAMALSRPSGQR